MMPTFLGEPLYPGGAPLLKENISINGEPFNDILLRYYEGNASDEDKETVKEYVLYFIGAPLFIIPFDSKEHELYFKKMPLDDMLDLLLDAGIDPL